MRRNALLLVMTGFCLCLSPSYAAEPAKPVEQAGQQQQQHNVPLSTVLQNLKMNGYDIVSKVTLDEGVYNIEALSPQGKELPITMDARSGEITSPKVNPLPHVNLMDAVKRVEGSGYHDIYKVEYSSGKYTVRALDQKDKKVKLKVDGETGEITKPWF